MSLTGPDLSSEPARPALVVTDWRPCRALPALGGFRATHVGRALLERGPRVCTDPR